MLQIFCWNLFIDDAAVSDFQDKWCSNLKYENTLTIEMRKHVTEAATERCSSRLRLAAFGYWQLFNFLWSGLCRIMSVCGSNIQDIQESCSENFIEYFNHSKNVMTKCMSAEIVFHISRFQDIPR